MSNTPKLVSADVAHNLPSLNKALTDYTLQFKKRPVDVLLKKGRDLSYKLYAEFRALAPRPGSITEASRSRGFRVRVRRKAQEMAEDLLQGQPSGRFLVSRLPDGRMKVVRQETKRITNRTLRKLGIGGKTVREMGGKVGVRTLNARAVATALELSFRERGLKVLGASWLYRRWNQLASRSLINVSPRSQVRLGYATLDSFSDRSKLQVGASLRLVSVVDGTAKVAQRTGATKRAIEAVRKDTVQYMKAKSLESLIQALKRQRTASP